MPKFESNSRRQEERIRKPAGASELAIGGYTDTKSGQPVPVLGNEDAPYSNIVGRASTTPLAADPGVPAVETGEGQRVLTDEYGRIITVSAPPTPGDLPLVANLIPQALNAGVLVVLAAPGELFDAWVGDYQSVVQRYLLVFNAIAAPAPGAVPAIAAPPIGGWENYDFTTSAGPMSFATGIVLALSTTPNSYTPIAAADDFAITARYKVT